MAARSRPRAGQIKDDFDEERNIWNSIRRDALKVDEMLTKSDLLSRRIADLAALQGVAEARGELPSPTTDSELESAIRENVNLTEQIQSLIGGSDSDSAEDPSTIIGSLAILSALRAANEPEIPKVILTGKPQRDRKRKHDNSVASLGDDRESIAADSPGGPSPKVHSSAHRLMGKSAPSRPSSVPPVREASVKAEDIDSADNLKERSRLSIGTEVLYRKKDLTEGEGILCSVTSVSGEGKLKRYEVMDCDPDPTQTTSTPYRVTWKELLPIPGTETGLPVLDHGKLVLAVYPQTTTFYKAEVVTQNGSKVKLRFEGEEEAGKTEDVDRRYVLLDVKSGK